MKEAAIQATVQLTGELGIEGIVLARFNKVHKLAVS